MIRQWLADSRRRWWLVGGGSALLIAVLAWVFWPSDDPQPRARQYLDFTACLLTDEQGINGTDAKPVWAGMQDASLATHAKVQFLSVEGEQTAANALPFLSSLAQGKCNMVFAAGKIPAAAVDQGAKRFPSTHFYVVGRVTSDGNVTAVAGSTADEVQRSVGKAIKSAVADS